jgi:HSP20 family protein
MFTVKPIPNFNRFLTETRREGRLLRAAFGPLAQAFTVPLADVFETHKEIVVKFDLPGVSRKNIAVDVHDKLLHVKAEKDVQHVESAKNVSRFERARSGFERAVWLPQTVDADHMTSSYRSGVLEVHLPKLS